MSEILQRPATSQELRELEAITNWTIPPHGQGQTIIVEYGYDEDHDRLWRRVTDRSDGERYAVRGVLLGTWEPWNREPVAYFEAGRTMLLLPDEDDRHYGRIRTARDLGERVRDLRPDADPESLNDRGCVEAMADLGITRYEDVSRPVLHAIADQYDAWIEADIT